MTNLDRCWKNCLRMCKWIADVYDGTVPVNKLKKQWLKKHGFRRRLRDNCFFCEYQATHGGGLLKYRENYHCKHCPGVYVSKTFDCLTPTCHFGDDPKGFYRKVLALDAKRTGKKKH